MLSDVTGLQRSPFWSSFNGYCEESWVWDVTHKSPDVVLSQNQQAAYFHIDPIEGSTGTAGVRGSRGFIGGEHYWEIVLSEPAWGTSVMIGVGTQHAKLHLQNNEFVDLLGMDQHSWGLSYKGTLWHDGVCHPYTQRFIEANTVIGVHLNMYEGTLTYYKNGQCLGVAFRGLNNLNEPLFPLISSTAEDTEMEVVKQSCRYLTLEQKCRLVIARTLRQVNDVNELPLPPVMKKQISDFV